MSKKGKNRNSIGRIGLLLIIPVLLSGCWNYRDLTDIGISAGLGLDRTEDGKILLTVQVVNPAAVQSALSGRTKNGGSQSKPVFVESYEGETVLEAVRGILSIVDKKIFFSTAQVLILGERLSQDGIVEVLDFFQRDHEIGYDISILVAKGVTPKEILEMEVNTGTIPAVYISDTINNTVFRGTVTKTMLIDLLKEIENSGRQPAIGQISKTRENDVKTEGTAVFRDGKLAGWLDPYETRGFLFAVDKIRSTIVNVPVDKGKAAMEIMESKGKIHVAFENGEPFMLNIRVEVTANVGGYEGSGKLESPDNLNMLKKSLEEEIEKEIRMALEKTQKEYSSDIYGFGTYVRKYHPQYWKKAKNDWNYIFSKLPADIQVDIKVMRTGVILSPAEKDE